ncbi:putative very large low complexity protein [Eutypa lata UCREL1]|uniref:ubiquitinyl hydrolase 1 n=1 Tax=Eutypa lata (strain UCR-EL1) TaxID=1287681 RepID=M7T562_EUTLA|nr:putative very large low complexity protein [Eutypa lata UCREL1]
MVKAVIRGQGARGSPYAIQDGPTQGLQHWPRLSPRFFLQRLARHWWATLSDDWKDYIVRYGVALTQMQRAGRMLGAIRNHPALMNELRNPGHTNWSPSQYPESLLLEVESGIMIREAQEQIGANMRNPPSPENVVENVAMQLNMGEGKSSVIVPREAAALANGSQLVRVIVAKPQSKQMYQMLISKLGGLLDRQVYQIPFSRSVKVTESEAATIFRTFEDCMTTGGILLIQPEHILSFKLIGIESAVTGKCSLSQSLTETQEFLNFRTRDVVDESDENFSVKFELVYTMGTQRPIEHSPERWICVQRILDIFREVLPEVRGELPQSVEVDSELPGSFPRTRILRHDAKDRILSRIAECVCATGLPGFPIARQPRDVREAVYTYITEFEPSTTVIKLVENPAPNGFWTGSQNTLLLLRGLIAGGILAFSFGEKRWRVDFGLDPSRSPGTRLAVPYRAKDNPSTRSEFSHPDVVIVLTSVSYYYGGLANADLELAFHHLLRSDQAELEYREWIKDAAPGLPLAVQQLVGINLDDRSQCDEMVYPHFRYAKGAIDYFLAHIVFPKEMKEFPHKLSASGWDIGERKPHPTTGFSGTNDSRVVLPLDIRQLDLEDQEHTNALVLENLLRPGNSVELMTPTREPGLSNAQVLLDMVAQMKTPTRVILDVGAQILELDNLEVAKEWLRNVRDTEGTQAVVFVDDNDELCVLDRKGFIEPLQISPYLTQLDMCLVYLDEAHTRGIDLKMPRNYRAAVTLGANLTKDRLVQGNGQAVVFCVSGEIQNKIRERFPTSESSVDSGIAVSDILAWTITETWLDVKRSMPLWAMQGRRHRRHKAILEQIHNKREAGLTKEEADLFLEDEARSLNARYRPRHDTSLEQCTVQNNADPITVRCMQFKDLRPNAEALQEEQERELSPEIEQEREDQRPPPAQPASHEVHRDILQFVCSGELAANSPAYMPAWRSLHDTSAASSFDVMQFSSRLLVTADFRRTVIAAEEKQYTSDSYQRPVQWILTSLRSHACAVSDMIVVSPYEANELLPRIAQSNYVALHIYAPRPNLGYRALDKLELYTVSGRLGARELPCPLVTELNLFAGQLYLSSFEEYVEVCKFLGLAWQPARDGEVIAADGFILEDSDGRVGGESGLQKSPVRFCKVLSTKIRRNCESINKTHMGKLLDNQLLAPDDFED